MSAITRWKEYYRDWRDAVHADSFYAADDANIEMQRYAREAALERVIERQARTIEARENSVLEIWQDWRKASDERDEARQLAQAAQFAEVRVEELTAQVRRVIDERDEARQLAVDFQAALEAAQRNYSESVEMLKAIGAALNVRTLGEIIPAIEALKMREWKLEAQEHNADDGNEWEKETYLRGIYP